MQKKTCTLIVVVFLVALLLLLPEIALKFLQLNSHKILTPLTIALLLGFALIVVLAKRYKVFFVIIGLMQTISIGHIGYFGTEIMPQTISKFFQDPLEDSLEVWEVFNGSFSNMHLLVLIGIASYAAIIYLLNKSYKLLPKLCGATLMMVLITFASPIMAFFHSKPYLFYPDPIKPSLYNLLNSAALYVRGADKGPVSREKFLPYQLNFSNPQAENIILIMGEGTRSDYLSLFAPTLNTTPLLGQRRNDENFVYKKGLSAAVSTATALQVFFNLMLEPGNIDAILTKQANLFRLAKQQGYQTILLSAQSSTLFYAAGTEFVDYFFTRKDIKNSDFNLKRDEILLDQLKKIPLQKKNFIVFHLRSQHAPYEVNYSHRKNLAIYSDEVISRANWAEANKMQYANATRFTDLLIDEIIKYSLDTFASSSSYVLYTSDHGELLGESGIWGHNHLQLNCAQVPFLMLGINPSAKIVSHFKQTIATHYDFGLFIAKLLGVEIVNPNIAKGQENIRYIHGLNVMHSNEHIKIDLNQDL